MIKKYIIDTNILIIANDQSSHVGNNDTISCKEFILSAYKDSYIYLDSLGLILKEYFKHASHSGQPGLGDAFAKYLFNNQANEKVCKRIEINLDGTNEYDIAEFPKDLQFQKFDLSDRKFVAVAISADFKPCICNGSDSDWYHHLSEFTSIGIQIQFICQELLKQWKEE